MTSLCVKDVGGRYDLHVRKRDDLKRTLTCKADGVLIDFTGSTLKAQVRRRANDAAAIAEITCTVTGPGVIELELDRVALTCDEQGTDPASKYRWDLSWTDAQNRRRTLLYGDLFVWAKVTVDVLP